MALEIKEENSRLVIEYRPMFSWLSLVALFLIPTLFVLPLLVGFGLVWGSVLSAVCFFPFIAIFLIAYFVMPKTRIVADRFTNKIEISSSNILSSHREKFNLKEVKGIYVKRFHKWKVTDSRNLLRKVPIVSYYIVFVLPKKLVYVGLKSVSKGGPGAGDKEVERVCDALGKFLSKRWAYVEGEKDVPGYLLNLERPKKSLGVVDFAQQIEQK